MMVPILALFALAHVCAGQDMSTFRYAKSLGLRLENTCMANEETDSTCWDKFNKFYDIEDRSHYHRKKWSIVFVGVKVKRSDDDEVAELPDRAVVKIQDVRNADTIFQRSGYAVGSEIEVGKMINELMAKYTPDGFPVAIRSRADIKSPEYRSRVYRYAGFAKTLDYGYCDSRRLEERDDEIRLWAELDRRSERNRLRLYVITEAIPGVDFLTFLRNGDDRFTIPIHQNRDATSVLQLMDHMRSKLTLMKSFLIQILSSLWYGTEYRFVQNDLFFENIMATKMTSEFEEQGEPMDFVFDFTRPIVQSRAPSSSTSASQTGASSSATSSSLFRPSAQDRPWGGSLSGRRESYARTRSNTQPVSSGARASRSNSAGYDSKSSSGAGGFINLVEEDITRHLITSFTSEPVMRFKIPSSVTSGYIFKIIDFGRSRAGKNGKYAGSGSPGENFVNFVPFDDIGYLGLQIFEEFPFDQIKELIDSNVDSRTDEFQKMKQELSELINQLAKVAREMISWHDLDLENRSAINGLIGATLGPGFDEKWTMRLIAALKINKDRRDEINDVREDLIYEYGSRMHSFYTKLIAEVDKNVSSRVQIRFLQKLRRILELPFFDDYLVFSGDRTLYDGKMLRV